MKTLTRVATPPPQFESVMVGMLTVKPTALRVARRRRVNVVMLTLPPLSVGEVGMTKRSIVQSDCSTARGVSIEPRS